MRPKQKRAVLADRVTWTDDPLGKFHVGRLGDFRIAMFMSANKRPYLVFAEWNGCRVCESKMSENIRRLDAAKAEALRIVQAVILDAAEAWRD